MRFPDIGAIRASLPHAFVTVGDRKNWCEKYGIKNATIARWQKQNDGAPFYCAPKYHAMCKLIEALEASGIIFDAEGFKLGKPGE